MSLDGKRTMHPAAYRFGGDTELEAVASAKRLSREVQVQKIALEQLATMAGDVVAQALLYAERIVTENEIAAAEVPA